MNHCMDKPQCTKVVGDTNFYNRKTDVPLDDVQVAELYVHTHHVGRNSDSCFSSFLTEICFFMSLKSHYTIVLCLHQFFLLQQNIQPPLAFVADQFLCITEMTSNKKMKMISLAVNESFILPDERLSHDTSYTEDVITTGVSVVKRKRDVETSHVLDEKSKALVDAYKKQIEELKEEHDSELTHLLKTCEEKQREISSKHNEIVNLENRLHANNVFRRFLNKVN